MSPDWKRTREIVERALELEPVARAAFVDEACGDDLALRSEVEALLASLDRTGSSNVPAAEPTEILPPVPAGPAGQLRVGVVVDGKYRIDGILGRGGMGAVYRATHIQLERPVALKAIRSDMLAHRTMGERFRREAVAVARLRHPNIVTVHDYGVAPDVGAYIVMELLEGRSLRDELKATPRLDVATSLAYVAQICAAVGAAHWAGVIHRDLKPENIFLERRDGEVSLKVVDFGLAKLEAAVHSADGLTQGSQALGTPGYMSPEQCRGEEADARSDVYAIGCVLFEVLTGERAFRGKSVWALMYQHIHEPPRRPTDIVPEIPLAIEAAVLRALAKDPDERHPTADAFARALGLSGASGEPLGFDTLPPAGDTLVSGNVTPLDRAAPGTRAPNNLPHAVTRFVGRERQIEEVRKWLGRTRLVTLVGPGGIGKSRLAIETASRMIGDDPDGVWLVELAPIADPALLARTVGAALGVRELGGRGEIDAVEAFLRDKRLLLVLDNCEHLVAACAELVERLLGACAGLRVLATSRESIGIAGEAAWPVPALAVPSGTARGASNNEAVQLFADRASLAKPGFELTESTSEPVAELCRRLEGIPLAIELAAARVKALTVEQILDRLDDRFRLLAGGNRAAPTRQQTLRATLDWSYDLLTEDERALLRTLGVFAGGWTLAEVEAIAGGDEVLDSLVRLVDKSLVVTQGQEPRERFRMLEIVREYARERLRESGSADDVARRHFEVYFTLAMEARVEFVGAREADWLARLEAEHDNMRAALAWTLEHEPMRCLELTIELGGFWSLHGHFQEGVRWTLAALDATPPEPSRARVAATRLAGELAWRKGDHAIARQRLEASMALARQVGGSGQIGWSCFHLALVIQQLGDAQASIVHLEEALERGREDGDDRLVGNTLNSLGEAARIRGDWAAAIPYFEQSLATHRRIGHQMGIGITLCNLGAAFCESSVIDEAAACYREALPSLRELGNPMGTSLALDGLGAIAAKREEWERAARLAGAADALRGAIGAELEPADRSMRDRYVGAVRERMDAPAFDRAYAAGAGPEREATIAEALA